MLCEQLYTYVCIDSVWKAADRSLYTQQHQYNCEIISDVQFQPSSFPASLHSHDDQLS